MSNRSKCKKLGNHATKRERAEAHRVKMEMKTLVHAHRHKEATTGAQPWIFANISKNHEHYGDTPAEHEKRKNNS